MVIGSGFAEACAVISVVCEGTSIMLIEQGENVLEIATEG